MLDRSRITTIRAPPEAMAALSTLAWKAVPLRRNAVISLAGAGADSAPLPLAAWGWPAAIRPSAPVRKVGHQLLDMAVGELSGIGGEELSRGAVGQAHLAVPIDDQDRFGDRIDHRAESGGDRVDLLLPLGRAGAAAAQRATHEDQRQRGGENRDGKGSGPGEHSAQITRPRNQSVNVGVTEPLRFGAGLRPLLRW